MTLLANCHLLWEFLLLTVSNYIVVATISKRCIIFVWGIRLTGGGGEFCTNCWQHLLALFLDPQTTLELCLLKCLTPSSRKNLPTYWWETRNFTASIRGETPLLLCTPSSPAASFLSWPSFQPSCYYPLSFQCSPLLISCQNVVNSALGHSHLSQMLNCE